MSKFYITTPIFYVNDKPHIGHAFTCICADTIARYHKLVDGKSFFLTGTDEHGAKIAKASEAAGKTPQEFTNNISNKFRGLIKLLNIGEPYDFIRTTDQERHWPGVFKIWETIKKSDDMYRGTYEGLYCVGHEAFMKKSDLKDGICPDHSTKPEVIKEENDFFKLTKYKKELEKIYKTGQIKIRPENRTNEVLEMLKDSEDVSFSRPRKDISWGIQVPGDETQTIYVWADALTNYLSAIGYGRNDDWQKLWPADIHLIGKDILRFHAIIWPAMLLSAGLELPKSIFVHGFITVDGQKMSKTIGNVVDPYKLVDKYGIDPVRYFLLREIPSSEDGDFSEKKLEERYNGDLANNLGNLVSRVAKLIETKVNNALHREDNHIQPEIKERLETAEKTVGTFVDEFKLHEALAEIFKLFSFANEYINEREPWNETDPKQLNETLINLGEILIRTNYLIWPFIPETAEKISKTLGQNHISKIWGRINITNSQVLFPRLK